METEPSTPPPILYARLRLPGRKRSVVRSLRTRNPDCAPAAARHIVAEAQRDVERQALPPQPQPEQPPLL